MLLRNITVLKAVMDIVRNNEKWRIEYMTLQDKLDEAELDVEILYREYGL